MKVKYIIVAVLGFLAGGLMLVWWLSPRLASWIPEDGIVGRSGSIGLAFTRAVTESEVAAYLEIQPNLVGEYRREENIVWFTPNDGFDYNQQYSASLRRGLGASNRLRSLVSYDKSFQIQDPELFFLKEDDGVVNVGQYLDGKPPKKITKEFEGIWDYQIMPDGQGMIVSAIDRDGSDDLVQIGLDGQRELVLDCVDFRCRDGRKQPGGQIIAFERQAINRGSSEVWLLDTKTGFQRPVFTPELAGLTGLDSLVSKFPRWSSDGQYLAYYKPDARIVIIQPMSGGEPIRIPANLQLLGEWSPTGKKIVYVEQIITDHGLTEEDENGQKAGNQARPRLYNHVVVANIENGEVIDLSAGGTFNDGLPIWHPDGQLLAVPRENDGGGRQIWFVEPERNDWSKVTDDPYYHYTGLSWSPDGSKLALMLTPVEQTKSAAEVHVLDPESGEMTLISNSAFLPGWLP